MPGCVLINESVFSRSPTSRPGFADLTERALCLTAFCARAALVLVLAPRDLRFITVVLPPGDILTSQQSPRSLGRPAAVILIPPDPHFPSAVEPRRHLTCQLLAPQAQVSDQTANAHSNQINGYFSATSAAVPKMHTVAIDRKRMFLRSLGETSSAGAARTRCELTAQKRTLPGPAKHRREERDDGRAVPEKDP
jgi:hypothetical protein